MSNTKVAAPVEQSWDNDPVARLVAILQEEGFTLLEESDPSGERIYHRSEKISFLQGETVFVLIDYPDLTDHILRSAVSGITELFRAKSGKDKAFSVFQATTVYVCIIARNESPHNARLSRYVTSSGGVVSIPVVIVPEINQVVYPSLEEGKLGSVRPRIEYLQYLLGERRERRNIHAQTIRTFYAAMGIVGLLLIAVLVTALT